MKTAIVPGALLSAALTAALPRHRGRAFVIAPACREALRSLQFPAYRPT